MRNDQAESGSASSLLKVRFQIIESDESPRITWFSNDDSNAISHRASENRIESSGSLDLTGNRKIGYGELAKRHKYEDYRPRIEYLQKAVEQEGYKLNRESEKDFEKFVRSHPGLREGELVLIDNGNLRAVWEDGLDTFLGLQFLGSNMVQFAIFKPRRAGQSISRIAGRDVLEMIDLQIAAFELEKLLY